jgi:hypothetical protein
MVNAVNEPSAADNLEAKNGLLAYVSFVNV